MKNQINSIENVSKYSKDIEEIHNEFETASDKLLLEATKIIEEGKTINISKVDRLQKLGFEQSNQVTELVPLIGKINLSKEQIELVSYYKLHYPNNKFITEEQVKYICYKYNLVCGDVNRYKGFVPEKNLNEIENFKLKDEDYLYEKRVNYLYDSKYSSCTKEDYERIEIGYEKRIVNKILKICAPIKDMDISDLELKDGYKLEKKFVPDPVVLQPVKGGYLILTAWGDESEDPVIVNNNFN